MFRLTAEHKDVATKELLEILKAHPDGISTRDLSGTPSFHGKRTLTNRQIIRLLKAGGQAKATWGGLGNRMYYVWKLKGATKN